jgi:hypothetical protein
MSAVSKGFAEGARGAHEQAQRIRAVLLGISSASTETPDMMRANGPALRDALLRAGEKRTKRAVVSRPARRRKA